MSYDPSDDPNKIFNNKVLKKVLKDNPNIDFSEPTAKFEGEKVEKTKEVIELAEGGKLELTEVSKWNDNGYRIAYGQIFKHTPSGSRLPYYMNHNYSICEKFFNELKKQFTGKKKG